MAGGGSEEHKLRIRYASRDLDKYVVVRGLIFERHTRTDQDGSFEVNVQCAEIRIATCEVQRLYAVAKVRKEQQLLGIVILRIRGLEAFCGYVPIQCRQAGGIRMTPRIDLERRQPQAG